MKAVKEENQQVVLDEGIKNVLKSMVENNYVEMVNVGAQIGWRNAFQMIQLYLQKLPGKYIDEQRMQLFINEYNSMLAAQKQKEILEANQ
jgi:hypothetical protein